MSHAEAILDLLRPARRAHEQGAIFYVLPEDLDPAQIDPLLREVVLNINLSGFCWTAESCQGHPDAAHIRDTAWDHNTEPFLRLVYHEDDEPRVLTALARSLAIPDDGAYVDAVEGLWNEYQPLRLYRDQRGEYAELKVYLPAKNAGQRNGGIEVFRRFSERLLAMRGPASSEPTDTEEE